MSEFGWAHITEAQKPAEGPDTSLQFAKGTEGFISGSENLTFNYNSNHLALTGTMVVSGTLRANVFDVITTTKTEIDVSGSTNFGNDNTDLHRFTGSVHISGGLAQNYYRLTNATYTANVYDSIIGVSSSAYTAITLPTAQAAGAGKILIIKDEWAATRTDAYQIAISASGGNKIDHGSTFSISGDNVALSIYSDGISKWFIY